MSGITTLDDFERSFCSGIGTPLPVTRPWRTVTTEWLERHSHGAGDYNPLYRSGEHADEGRFHAPVGAPSFLFSIDFGANASIWGHIPHDDVAMTDLTILYLGADIEWHRPVWLGDRVRSIETPVGVRRREMSQVGEALVCSGRTDYYNHREELVASMTNHMLRFVNPGRGVASSPASRHEQVAPDPLVWERTRRGREVLWFEDAAAGEKLPDLPKGTFTTTELYLFSHGTLTMGRSRKMDTGTIDMGAGGRADPEYARKARAQAASFDYGPQRIAWLTQIISDWMGDWGDLVALKAQLRRPNLIGDTNTLSGTVERTYLEGEEGRADVRVAVVNQEGVESAVATGTVRLPRRERGEPARHLGLWAPAEATETTVYG